MDELNKLNMNISDQINEYNNKFNKYKNKKYCNNIDGDNKLAEQIYNEYNNNDIKTLFDNIISENFIRHNLLKYELHNYIPLKKEMSMAELLDIIYNYIDRYQFKAGGFLLEDFKWKLYLPTDSKYNLLENQLLLENSTTEYGSYNNETKEYLDKLIQLINNTSNIKSKYKFKYTNNIVWVIIIINI